MLVELAIGNDNLVRLDDLADSSTGLLLNTGALTAQLRDANLNPVGGPLPFAQAPGVDGRYEVTLPASLIPSNTSDGTPYYVDIAGTLPGAFWRRVVCIARVRG